MPSSRGWKTRRVLVLWAGLLALLLGLGIQVRGLGLGRLDNNDWLKYAASMATGPVGHAAVVPTDSAQQWKVRYQDRWLRFWHAKWLAEAPHSQWDTGPSWLLWLPSYLVQYATGGDKPVIDLKLLGLPVRIGIAAAFALLVGGCVLQFRGRRAAGVVLAIGLVALAMSVFDVTVISYANSFFRESSSQLFALALLALLAALPGRSNRLRWWVAATVALLVTSATAHLPLVAACWLVWLWLQRVDRSALAVPLALASLGGVVFGVLVAEPTTARNAAFNSLFYGALPHSEHPDEHLDRLGLPAAARDLVGKRAFSPEAELLVGSFPEVFTHRSLAVVILHEPSVVWHSLWAGAPELGRVGYLPREEAGEPRHDWLWIDAPRFFVLRQWEGSGRALLGMASLLGLVALAALSRSREGWTADLARITVLTVAIVWIELGVNALADGRSGLNRHLFLARLALDQALIFGAVLVATMVAGRDGGGRQGVGREA